MSNNTKSGGRPLGGYATDSELLSPVKRREFIIELGVFLTVKMSLNVCDL